MAVSVSAALTVFTTPAWAQSQVTYSLAGVETAATSTQGSFVGLALSLDDFATWAAVILHDELNEIAPSITGGVFALNGAVRDLQGIITGGEIEKLGGSCRKETFAVRGDVLLVDGSGEFNVTLTHYGRRVPGGNCVTFFATVEGLVTFTLLP